MDSCRIFYPCFFIVFTLIRLYSLYGEEKTVIITTLTDYKPYCFEKENSTFKHQEIIPAGSDSSHFQGYSWDIVRESFHEMRYKIILMVAPWKRCMIYLSVKEAHVIFPAVKTTEREKEFLFSNENVHLTNIIIYTSSPLKDEWKGLKTFNDQTICAIRGWAYGEEWESNRRIRKYVVDKIPQCFKLLEVNRVFGVIGYEIPFDYYLKENEISGNYQKSPPINSIGSYLMGSKDNPSVPEILKDFDQGKRKILENGKFEKIIKKWR